MVGATLVLGIAACGGAPTCALEGEEVRVIVDASELTDVRRICIENRCSSENEGVLRFVANFSGERPERVGFEVNLADGGGQTVRSGGLQLACDARGREVTLTPKPDGTDQITVR